MTLNAVITFILHLFSPNWIDFQADYITVVEDRPIMSVKYCLPVPVFYLSMSVPYSHECMPLVPAKASRGLAADIVTGTQPYGEAQTAKN